MIAVNSGSSLSKVASYAKQNKIRIPVIADVDRSLERTAGLRTKVSLQNIWQVRVVKADGSVIPASARDLDASMAKATEGAEWNIDPTEIPASMRTVWQAVEFGNYASAAKPLGKLLKTRKKQESAAANRLNDYIASQMRTRIENAQANLESKPWSAYKQFNQIQSAFKGFELPSSVDNNLKSLAQNENVKTEILARKQLQLAQKAAAGNSSAKQRAIRILERLIEKYPDTEAAKTATQLMQ